MRRLLALLMIAVLLTLVGVLFWKVWEHHDKSIQFQEEPAVVSVSARSVAVIFAAHPW
ncbi:MAG TPA: hypothetical protein VF618_27515 [Thermoanaerobaculia bacterium]